MEENKGTIEIPVGKYFGRFRENPWIVSTIVLALVLLGVLIFSGSGSSGNVVSAETAGQNALAFINSNPQLQGTVNLVGVERDGQFYEVTLLYEGQEVPVFTTLDGEFLVSNLVPLTDIPETGDTGEVNTVTATEKQTSEDDDAFLGDENAPVTIIEFSDYQCPFCQRFWSETLPLIKEEYIDTGKVKLVYRDYPLAIHSQAQIAAEAAECVRAKGGDKSYFEMHDKVFENQQSLSEDNLVKWAKELGYDISDCLENEEFKDEVLKDMSDGGSLGTPTFFINGVKIEGAQPFSVFKQIIDVELSK